MAVSCTVQFIYRICMKVLRETTENLSWGFRLPCWNTVTCCYVTRRPVQSQSVLITFRVHIYQTTACGSIRSSPALYKLEKNCCALGTLHFLSQTTALPEQRLLSRYSYWTVRGSNPVSGEIFHTRPYRIWGPPSLMYNGYLVSFPGSKRPERDAYHPPSSSAQVKERVELCLYSISGTWCPIIG